MFFLKSKKTGKCYAMIGEIQNSPSYASGDFIEISRKEYIDWKNKTYKKGWGYYEAPRL